MGKLDSDIFRDFASTQEDRENADYGIMSDISKNDAKDSIIAADNFLDNVEELL